MATKNIAQFVKHGRKIIGVGMNYRSLAADLNWPLVPEPIIFSKPVSSYITQGQKIKLVSDWKQVHYEVELGVVIGKTGVRIPQSLAMDHVAGYCVALDMTSVDLIGSKLVPKGLPWDLAKGFDTACPVGDFIPKEKIPDPQNLNLWLKLNNEIKQQANTNEMLFSLPRIIQFISDYMTLEEGDLIITGTPGGLGPATSGDSITCGIKGITEMTYEVE